MTATLKTKLSLSTVVIHPLILTPSYYATTFLHHNLGKRPATLDEIIRGFPQSLYANVGVIP
jgi:hypothetical protein